MAKAISASAELALPWAASLPGVGVGQLLEITREGKALVDFPGNPGGPVEARSVVAVAADGEPGEQEGRPVLLVFENGDPGLPIIVGLIRDVVRPPVAPAAPAAAVRPAPQILAGAKKVVVEAGEELVLRCGKGSLTVRRDGKIIIKGTEIVSRSSGANKIRGACVVIN